MSTSKRSATGATNLNTGKLTSPIIFKLICAFAITTLLGVILTFFSLLNLGRNTDKIDMALENQRTVARASVLTTLLLKQYQEGEEILFDGEDASGFGDLRQKIAYELILNLEQSTNRLNLTELSDKERDFLKIYDTLIKEPLATRTANRNTSEAQLRDLTNEMIAIVDGYSRQFSQQTQANLIEMQKVQNEAFNGTFLFSLVALAIMGAVVWFVLTKVIQPLGRINEQLSLLLWSQNEHLTEQLNILQQEINTNNEMLTAVRHDLKTPLSSIKGLAQLSVITQPDLPTDTEQNLAKIIEVADSSVETISNLLTRREIKLELQPVPLDHLVDKVTQLVDLRWFNITRKVEPIEVVMDAGLMEHALLNLVSNARKFSGGGIGIGATKRLKPGTVDEEELELWVWNDGAVITAGDREEIFKPGKQTTEGKKVGGHGLGLAIVKSIAERHHGRVSVDSHEKKGTTFRIIIPIISLNNDHQLAPQPAAAQRVTA